MSTYIMLINYTEQGILNIKESPKRAEAARDVARACGAEMKDLYLTMGPYDLVETLERLKAQIEHYLARFESGRRPMKDVTLKQIK